MQTNQIRLVAKTTKRKAKTKAGRLEAYEAGLKLAQPRTIARLSKYGLWNPYAATGSSVVVYKKGEEPK